jgi:hypothetical protein
MLRFLQRSCCSWGPPCESAHAPGNTSLATEQPGFLIKPLNGRDAEWPIMMCHHLHVNAHVNKCGASVRAACRWHWLRRRESKRPGSTRRHEQPPRRATRRPPCQPGEAGAGGQRRNAQPRPGRLGAARDAAARPPARPPSCSRPRSLRLAGCAHMGTYLPIGARHTASDRPAERA